MALALAAASGQAHAAVFNVTDETELRNAIFTASTNGGTNTVNLTGDIMLTRCR